MENLGICISLAAQLDKLAHISCKHLMSYILKRQADGKSASTIKTDLAAIRFLHDKIASPKYRLPATREKLAKTQRKSLEPLTVQGFFTGAEGGI